VPAPWASLLALVQLPAPWATTLVLAANRVEGPVVGLNLAVVSILAAP